MLPTRSKQSAFPWFELLKAILGVSVGLWAEYDVLGWGSHSSQADSWFCASR